MCTAPSIIPRPCGLIPWSEATTHGLGFGEISIWALGWASLGCDVPAVWPVVLGNSFYGLCCLYGVGGLLLWALLCGFGFGGLGNGPPLSQNCAWPYAAYRIDIDFDAD